MQNKEFTLPFVGREEELKFLLHEYDQMLHAQYRSVWIEAPAGMGKTTLVEEFLKRIAVGAGSPRPSPGAEKKHRVAPSKGGETPPLQPWIVHAHLRERSSNSLASFVEVLGGTLQTLNNEQREKLFSSLTTFYQERARKIVEGGNIQSMDMEEAITTSGYILKQLSKCFPLVVIIEDIHVLKGEISFYALRHLQAVVEHVPMMMIFISRPSEEKQLKQFQDASIVEGCKKKTLEGLREEGIRNLVEANGMRPTDVLIKKIAHLSGGNALLLRELLRSESLDEKKSSGSTTEKILYHLLKELERLPKRDRQVVAIAGMLGEEFSEQLLEEITQSKDFSCWSDDALSRFEARGIVRRRKKILRPEGEKKEIALRVSVFSHALWWEAARTLYRKEKTWTDRKFSETVVPLLRHEDYPLVTDAEFIVNLFRWLPKKKSLPLLLYLEGLDSVESKWHFHSDEELVSILKEVYRSIEELLKAKFFRGNEQAIWAAVALLNAGSFVVRKEDKTMFTNRFSLARRVLSNSLETEGVLKIIAEVLCAEGLYHCQQTDQKSLAVTYKEFRKFRTSISSRDQELKQYVIMIGNIFNGLRFYFEHPRHAAEYFFRAATFHAEHASGKSLIAGCLSQLYSLTVDQDFVRKAFERAQEFRKEESEKNYSGHDVVIVRSYRAETMLSIQRGDIHHAQQLVKEVQRHSEQVSSAYRKYTLAVLSLAVLAHKADKEKGLAAFTAMLQSHRLSPCQLLAESGKELFLLEAWEHIEALWQAGNQELLSGRDRVSLPGILEVRMLMCLLLKNDAGTYEAVSLLTKLSKNFPAMKHRVNASRKKMEAFLILWANHSADAKKKFDKFLSTDETLSQFDKAHYAQLFARIAVRHGYDPKEYFSYAEYSLKEFITLGLRTRIVVTAEALAAEHLISQQELREIRKKFVDPIEHATNEKEQTVLNDEDNSEGITLLCLGQIMAFDRDGRQIGDRKLWGNRESEPSHTKRIVLELVRGKYEGRAVTRKELLEALFSEERLRAGSKKKIAKFNRILSARLSELKRAFAPHEIFTKVEEGFVLHQRVSTDLLNAMKDLARAKVIAKDHLPSAQWLLHKAKTELRRGEFAQGIHSSNMMAIRRKLKPVGNDIIRLEKELEQQMSF